MSDSGNRKGAPEKSAIKQKRALITRRGLLKAARVIFARDGFEHARIEDIAARAGKTRGAFYANFTDKEDVFFAIFEEDTDRHQAALIPLLQHLKDGAARIAALGQYLSELCQDRQRMLLGLEFKLYAIRHPRKRKRLANLHAAMHLRFAMAEIRDLVPGIVQGSVRRRRSESLALGGIVDGLALNRLFDPAALSEPQLARYLTLCLKESLLDPPSGRTSPPLKSTRPRKRPSA